MGRGFWSGRFLFVAVAGAMLALAAPARAQTVVNDLGAVGGPGGRIGNWTIGALAYTSAEPLEPRISDLSNKVRIGSSLLPKLEPYAEIRPWVAVSPMTEDGSLRGMGGVLIDVPLGSFVFTPSFGAGTLPRSPYTPRAGATAMEFRSQLELGYEFANRSRFSLSYSRIDNTASTTDGSNGTNNVFGLYYHMPFGALLDR